MNGLVARCRRLVSWLGTRGRMVAGSRTKHARLNLEQLEAREVAAVAAFNLATIPLPIANRADLGAAGQFLWNQRFEQIQGEDLLGHRDVLFLGDSITETLPTIGSGAWGRLLAPLGAVNFGIGGATTSELLWLLRAGLVSDISPKVVVLEAGTNNLLRGGQTAQQAAEGVAEIVAELRRQLPNARIIVQGVLPLGSSPSDPLRQQSQQFNQLIGTWLAAINQGGMIGFIDSSSYFVLPSGAPSTTLLSDGVHPTAAGYEIYTGLLYPFIVASLAASS